MEIIGNDVVVRNNVPYKNLAVADLAEEFRTSPEIFAWWVLLNLIEIFEWKDINITITPNHFHLIESMLIANQQYGRESAARMPLWRVKEAYKSLNPRLKGSRNLDDFSRDGFELGENYEIYNDEIDIESLSMLHSSFLA